MNKSYVASLSTEVVGKKGKPTPDAIRLALIIRVMTAQDRELSESLDDEQETDQSPSYEANVKVSFTPQDTFDIVSIRSRRSSRWADQLSKTTFPTSMMMIFGKGYFSNSS